MKLSFASSLLVAAVLAVSLTTGTVLGPDGTPVIDTPYRYSFYYTDIPNYNCNCDIDFFRIVDATYQEYAQELVFTTTVNYTTVETVDPRWNKVAGFYEARSKNLEKYRGDRDIWSGIDQYNPNGHYDDTLDTMYTDPTTSLVGPSTPATADSRSQFAQDYIPIHTADNTVVMTDDKNNNRKNLRKQRKLSQNDYTKCGLQIAIGRTKELDCVPANLKGATGFKNNVDTLKQGSGAAELFYENVDILLKDHTTAAPLECKCKDKINKMKYSVIETTV